MRDGGSQLQLRRARTNVGFVKPTARPSERRVIEGHSGLDLPYTQINWIFQTAFQDALSLKKPDPNLVPYPVPGLKAI